MWDEFLFGSSGYFVKLRKNRDTACEGQENEKNKEKQKNDSFSFAIFVQSGGLPVDIDPKIIQNI